MKLSSAEKAKALQVLPYRFRNEYKEEIADSSIGDPSHLLNHFLVVMMEDIYEGFLNILKNHSQIKSVVSIHVAIVTAWEDSRSKENIQTRKSKQLKHIAHLRKELKRLADEADAVAQLEMIGVTGEIDMDELLELMN